MSVLVASYDGVMAINKKQPVDVGFLKASLKRWLGFAETWVKLGRYTDAKRAFEMAAAYADSIRGL